MKLKSAINDSQYYPYQRLKNPSQIFTVFSVFLSEVQICIKNLVQFCINSAVQFCINSDVQFCINSDVQFCINSAVQFCINNAEQICINSAVQICINSAVQFCITSTCTVLVILSTLQLIYAVQYSSIYSFCTVQYRYMQYCNNQIILLNVQFVFRCMQYSTNQLSC